MLPEILFFLLQNEKGFLGYTDVSMGTRVAGICTGLGRLDTMTQNPANAIIHLGHASGRSRSMGMCKSRLPQQLVNTQFPLGMLAAGIRTVLRQLDTMTQNPANVIIHLGHASGRSRSTGMCKSRLPQHLDNAQFPWGHE